MRLAFRDRIEQRLCISVLRILYDLACFTVFDNLTLIHDVHAITQLCHDGEIVTDKDDCRVAFARHLREQI